MEALPQSYFVAVAVFVTLLFLGAFRFKADWAIPFNTVLVTVAAWYLVEPLYAPDGFLYLDQAYIDSAFQSVTLYFVAFALFTPLLVRQLTPRALQRMKAGSASMSAEQVLKILVIFWLTLLAYGTLRLGGDIVGAMFPIEGRAGARMWGRAAGAGAGSEGFVISTASYLYTLCLASFGVMLFIVEGKRYQAIAVICIILSWPYAFLQGSRNITLAVVVPALIAYLLFARQPKWIKLPVLGACVIALDFAFRIIISYRNQGFEQVDLSEVGGVTHLGLNMASELVYCSQFIGAGILELSYGLAYIQEVANVVPRAIWPDKPLIGVDYAIARGFGGVSTDIGVFATISTGLIGQAVLSFGAIVGPIFAAFLMSGWVALLTRFRRQHTPLRLSLFLIGLGLTFSLGRDVTLLVLWPIVFGYVAVRVLEAYYRRRAPSVRAPARFAPAQAPEFRRYGGRGSGPSELGGTR